MCGVCMYVCVCVWCVYVCVCVVCVCVCVCVCVACVCVLQCKDASQREKNKTKKKELLEAGAKKILFNF